MCPSKPVHLVTKYLDCFEKTNVLPLKLLNELHPLQS